MKASLHKSVVLFFALLLAVGLVGGWFVLLPGTARAAVYTVTLTTDTLPAGVAGELRFEINAANATPGVPDTINFAIPGAGPHTISPAAALPNIADQLFIDGYSQPGSAPATPVLPATILIELDGTGAGAGVHGLSFTSLSNNSRVRGLAIDRFNGSGVYIQPNTTGVQVDGNYIGTDSSGTVALANGDRGVFIMDNANNNTVGGTAAANRNVISGNGTDGVRVRNAGGNIISANYIGTDATGTNALANSNSGVYLNNGSVGNTIGGNTPGHRNIISGNTQHGVNIHNSHSNNIYGNYIGIDLTGTVALGNTGSGVNLEQGSINNNIGGNGAGEGNIISGNNGSGVEMPGGGAHCTGNLVRGNYIGTDVTGNLAVPNVSHGVYIHGGSNTNTVGGDSTIGEGNIISGNGVDGVRIWFSSTNWVRGNYIGTDAGGANPLPNGISGVYLWNFSNNNTIGGTTAGHRNVISGNTNNGVYINNATGNDVQGNYIGIQVNGTVALANGWDGVSLSNGANNNAIGGAAVGECNIISGNSHNGINTDSVTGNDVEGNYIGVDVTGGAVVANGWNGVSLNTNSSGNTIGGSAAGEGNVISGNVQNGVRATNSTGNFFEGNYIGTDAGGTLDLGNGGDGIYLGNADGNTIGGTTANEGNVISGNAWQGVSIDSSDNNTVSANYIGTDANGAAVLTNDQNGVNFVNGSTGNTVGGSTTGERNVISGNTSNGVRLDNSTGNFVEGNLVGTDVGGTLDLGNSVDGIYLGNNADGNTIGGPTSNELNVISGNTWQGVSIDSSDNNTVSANYIGTDATGAAVLTNDQNGVNLVNGSTGNTVGGSTAGERNIISGNTQDGVRANMSAGNDIQGNYIGTDVNGTAALPNATGIYVTGSNNDTIGGTTAGHRNIISGNGSNGVHFDNSCYSFVQGNYIGADVNGAALGNGTDGVSIAAASDDTTVGGSAAAMNKIAYNGQDGVGIQSSYDCEVSFNYIKSNTRTGVVVWNNTAIRDKISENVIYGNGALGIDLGGDGVTPNDGNNNNLAKPNRGYNFPVFTAGTFPVGAAGSGGCPTGNATVTGTAPPNSIVEIFYTGSTPDPTGHGEGIVHLKTVTADGSGNFTADLTGVSGGEHISATATSPAGDPAGEGNTSEFSGNTKLVGANLEVIKAAPEQVEPGAPITYTITIENKGDDDALNVTFTDDIPANTTVVAGTVSCCDPGATVVSEDPVKITGITIMTGNMVAVTFDVMIDEGTKAGTVIENQAFITYGTSTVPSSDPGHPGEGMPTGVTVGQSKTPGSTSWFIAEGSTGEGFDTWILLQNSNDAQATVDVTFTTDSGPADIVTLVMEPRTRTTVRIADYVPDTWGVSTIITSSEPIVAERSMYWDKRLEGESNTPGAPQPFEMRSGHANLGTPGEAMGTSGGSAEGGRTHYFPEGATAGFDTWILLVNPNWLDAQARVVLMTGSGVALEKDLVVPAMSRATVHLDEYLPDASEVATEVTSDMPLVAERSMYWDPDEVNIEAYQMRGGHSNAGSPTADNNWYLAEGSTGGGFETYVLLQNPADTEAPVTATFSDAGGVANHANLTMPPRSRATLKVGDYVPDNFHVSTSVTSDVAIVAERSMYWDKRVVTSACQMRDGHSTVGVNATGNTWMVPEGSTGVGFDSFVLIANTESTDVAADVVFMTADGPRQPVLITIPANSRYTVRIADYVPDEFQVSTTVLADGVVVVERAMYWDSRETYPLHSYDIRPYEMMGGHSASGLDP